MVVLFKGSHLFFCISYDDRFIQCYVFDNILLWQYNVPLETFVVLSSYVCGNVLVELKLLQVICNKNVVLEPKREKKKKKLTYSSGQKPPLKD